MDNTTFITVETTVYLPLDKVWAFWTEPKHIVNWNFASDTWHCPKAENNLTIGGSFKYTMAAKDGSFSFDFEGKYLHVKLLEYIESELGDNRLVKVTFTAEENAVKVTEIFEAEKVNPIELQKGGWQAILDNFRKYTEAN